MDYNAAALEMHAKYPGKLTVIIGITLYSLLPIVRNTCLGLQEVDPGVKEAARGMGMSKPYRILMVEFPLAFPTVFTGIRIAVVNAIGTAVFAAFVGGGGLGGVITQAIRISDMGSIALATGVLMVIAVALDLIMSWFEGQMRKSRGGSKKMWIPVAAILLAFCLLLPYGRGSSGDIMLYDGDYSETQLMHHMVKMLVEDQTDLTVTIQDQMSQVNNWNALKDDGHTCDLMISYDGTLLTTFFHQDTPDVPEGMTIYDYVKEKALEDYDLHVLGKLGFENTYAIGVPEDLAEEYGLATISRALVAVAGFMGASGNVGLMLLFTAIAALGQGPWQGDMNAVIAACSEYTWLTKHKRVDGTMYSCTSLGVKLGGGVPYYYHLTKEHNFLPNVKEIPDDVADKAKMMIVSLPANPVGSVGSPELYQEIVDFCNAHKILLIHDNAYSDIIFDGAVGHSIFNIPGAETCAVEFFSLSKSFNVTGARISFLVGRRDVIAACKKLRTQIDFGKFIPEQKAAIAAMTGPLEPIKAQCAEYQRRRDALCGGFRSIGWDVPDSHGSMFVWAPVPQGHGTSMEFCMEMIEKAGVICTPGSSFGPSGEGYVRFALTLPVEKITEAVQAVKNSGLIG